MISSVPILRFEEHDAIEFVAKSRWSCEVSRRVALCEQAIQSVVRVAEQWAAMGAEAKGCGGRPEIVAEELLTGPAVILRFLQLAKSTLEQLDRDGRPRLPSAPFAGEGGVVEVPIVPTSGLYDSLVFLGLSGVVRMQKGVPLDAIHGDALARAQSSDYSKISAVLGAGNVSSVPATDSLNRMLFESRRVVLKMNPVNSYLHSVFEEAFAPFLREGLFQIITGDATKGQYLIHHPCIADVHITGSIASHDRIVWGDDPRAQAKQKLRGAPLLAKPITSELGNVSPWLIVPGRYTTRELESQAEHVAASITNNASFNCLATRVIVTWSGWPQRDLFLRTVERLLRQTPNRVAYYPGAVDRYCRFAGLDGSLEPGQTLPWTLLSAQSIRERPELFTEESFACVCAETCLDSPTPEMFVQEAVSFANDCLAGTLCASITIPRDFRRNHPSVVHAALRDLRYTSLCVNQWSGLAYSLVSPPWGGYPGATLDNAGSGMGAVHNTYLLDRFEKSILSGPLINYPRPVWFPSHRNALSTARRLIALYQKPTALRLPSLFGAALRG